MKRYLVLISILVISSVSRADWRFGVGLGVQSQFQDVTEIEAGTGPLFSWRDSDFSLLASVALRETELKDIKNEHYSASSFKVMLESRTNGATATTIATPYVRLGLGYTVTDKVFDSDGGFIIMPFQLGLDVKVRQTDSSSLSFYIQAASEINFLGRSTPARDFDGTAITLGFHGFY